MEEFQTIPTKELQELVDRLLKKSEAAHEKYNKATEEYNQLMDRYYDCGDIIEEFKKRKGYDSKTNEFPVSMWLDKHRRDPDPTQEEKDAIEDIRIIRRIKLRDADQARAVARATWEAYLDAAELADYFPNYNINSKAW